MSPETRPTLKSKEIEKAVRDLFRLAGLREVQSDTIRRYSEVLTGIASMRQGYDEIKDTPESIKKGLFEKKAVSGLIIQKDIPLYSFCEHHILPWFGQVHIAYIARGKVLGLSKFTRVVNYFSQGITIQEDVAQSIMDFFVSNVSTDVMVQISAIHTCMVSRGVENPYATTTVNVAHGEFKAGVGPRLEFLEALRK